MFGSMPTRSRPKNAHASPELPGPEPPARTPSTPNSIGSVQWLPQLAARRRRDRTAIRQRFSVEQPTALAGCRVDEETTGGEQFGLRGICFACGVAFVGAVLECRIPPSKRPLASFEYSAPPSPAGPQPRRPRLLRPVQAGAPARIGPAGCAVLLQTRFDRRLDCCPSGDLGGEEGCAADRASAMLEPAARRGAGGSETFKGCQSLVGGIP